MAIMKAKAAKWHRQYQAKRNNNGINISLAESSVRLA